MAGLTKREGRMENPAGAVALILEFEGTSFRDPKSMQMGMVDQVGRITLTKGF